MEHIMTGAVPQLEEATEYSRVRASHRTLAVLYRHYPAVLSVEAVSEVVGCSCNEARAVLDRLLQTNNLIEQQRSSAGVATYSASQS